MLRYPFSCIAILLFCGVVAFGVYYRVTLANVLYYPFWRTFSTEQFTSGYVQNQGASLYYEVHGQGQPLVLLHGGLASIDVFFAQLPKLAQSRQVIAIDLRGQGRSSIGQQGFTYRLLTQDVIAVLDALHIDSADFVGWSDGGIIGLIVGLEYPQRIRRLIAIGANFEPEGLTAATREYLRTTDSTREAVLTRLWYWLRSPEPERWQELWQKVNTMWLTRPDLSVADLGRIAAHTLVVVGENDQIDLAHAKKMANGLIDGELLVVPEAGHNLLTARPRLILDVIEKFLADSP